MPDFGDLIGKAKDLASQHPDQVHNGLEKAEDLIDEKLGGEHSEQVEKASDVVENFLGIHNEE